MKYRLFLSDFDGTLVRRDGTVSSRNCRAIADYRAAGGIFAVVTGRMLTSILPRLKELGLTEGIVCAYQGATIASIADGTLLKNGRFEQAEALSVIRYLEERHYHVHVYTVEKLYSNVRDELLGLYEKTCGVQAEIEPNLSDMVARDSLPVIKVLVMVMPEEREKSYREIAERFPSCYVTCSSEVLVEIMPIGQDKAGAADFLSGYYGIGREEIAAIGDQLNDLPMLEHVGGRFAVANAVPQLRKCATVVASCEEDGVAQAIYEYALGD